MSKDFETEYRKQTDLCIPDLWDRIEAGLPKGAPAQESISVQKTDPAKEKSSNPTSVVRFFTGRRTAALLTAAAAVLCILAIRPVTLHMKEQESAQGQQDGVAAVPNAEHSDSFNNMTDFFKDKLGDGKSDGAGEAADAEAETNYAPNVTQSAVSSDASGMNNGQTVAGDHANSEVNLAPMEQESDQEPDEGQGMPSEQDIAGAQAAAEAYYEETVYEVLSMEVKTGTREQIVFNVQCNKGGKRVDPDRTIEVTFNGEQWEVTNEGY